MAHLRDRLLDLATGLHLKVAAVPDSREGGREGGGEAERMRKRGVNIHEFDGSHRFHSSHFLGRRIMLL